VAEPRGADRVVYFTDAVVAIAITLLVLPLVDTVDEAVNAGDSSVEVITRNLDQVFSFLLSFVVIARLWTVHHRLFDGVATATHHVIALNMLWVLTIVVLPFPTEMVGGYGEDRFTVGLYIGTILASSACLTALSVAMRGRLAGSGGSTTALFALALVLALFVPGVSYWALLLLFLVPLAERLWKRWRPRARSGAAAGR
jgi:uncharacterized membrane protein